MRTWPLCALLAVPFCSWNIGERRHEAEDVIAPVAAVTGEHLRRLRSRTADLTGFVALVRLKRDEHIVIADVLHATVRDFHVPEGGLLLCIYPTLFPLDDRAL